MRKNDLLVFSLVALLISGFCWFKFFTETKEITENNNKGVDYSNVVYTPEWISVEIKGEVQRPMVYKVPSNWILADLLSLAGSKSTSDLGNINLASLLTNGMSYYIPKIGEKTEGGVAKVALNSATKEQLMTLPGIGAVIADRIIAYRQSSYFASIEEIKNVSGIGDAIFDKIKDLITL